jgi:hypothetical protein
MMTPIPFLYSREIKQVKKDENGKAIPLQQEVTNPDGTIQKVDVPNKFETETILVEDSMNMCKYIRHVEDQGSYLVLLDDGHEAVETEHLLKNKKKPATMDNIREVNKRVWRQSEIWLTTQEDKDNFKRYLKILAEKALK